MNHADVEEQGVVDLYLRNRLSEEEAVRFEQHYLSCPACLDQLEAAEGLERGLRRAATQDAAAAVRGAAVRQLAAVAWLARLGRSRQAALLVSGLLLLMLVPSLALRQAGELREELQQTRSALAAEQAAGRSREAAETGQLRAALETSRRDLARERQERERAAAELEAALDAMNRPQVNLPLLFLERQRGGPGPSPDQELPGLRLPRQPGWTVLSLTVDPPHPPSYVVTLRGPGRREVWRGTGLRPDALDVLTLALPTGLLAPGDHVLTVEPAPAAGRAQPAVRFPFRVLPPA